MLFLVETKNATSGDFVVHKHGKWKLLFKKKPNHENDALSFLKIVKRFSKIYQESNLIRTEKK